VSKRNQIERMPVCPESPTGAHHWLMTVGFDEQGRRGSHGVCKVCEKTRFDPAPTLQQAHRAYGRLPKKDVA
jgi:hypothetical protein